MSVKSKLMLTFTTIVVLVGIIVGIAISQMVATNQTIEKVHDLLAIKVSNLSEVYEANANADDQSYYAQLNVAGFNADVEKSLMASYNALSEAAAKLGDDPAEEDIVGIKNNINEYITSATKDFIPALRAKDADTASSTYDNKLDVLFQAISQDSFDAIYKQNEQAEEMVQSLNSMTNIIILSVLGGLVVVLVIVFGTVLSRKIQGELSHAVEVSKTIASGDLTHEIKHNSNDEFGDLEISLEQMRKSLLNLVTLIQEAANSINASVARVHDVTNLIADSAQQAQNRAITVAAASDEMVSTTADIAKNCAATAKSADQTNQTTINGSHNIDETIAIIKQQATQSGKDAENMNRLADQANKVSSIIETIEDIADQTNLLALNAAIEAARAGEAGKGFAVVADEVRSLASRTSSSTQEITRMVVSMQQDAKICSDSMTASFKNMDNIADRTNDIHAVLKEVEDQAATVSSQITQIATAAEQQTTATSEISTNMQGITEATKSFTENADEANREVENAVAVIDDLLAHLKIFKV